MIEQLIQADKQVFVIINQRMTSSLLDSVFPFIRVPEIWLPLYLFLFLYVFFNMQKRQALWWILCFITIVSCCDVVSSQLIKQTFYRMRPCYDPCWQSVVRHLTTYCSHTSSFTSSHACNHFGMAFFCFLSLKNHFKNYTYLFFVWAGLISYAQIYVGVHYPLDVVCGALLGIIISLPITRYYFKNYNL